MADPSRFVGRTHTVCPYTLRPLSEVGKVAQAHIFPHAIGGGLDYAVLTDGACDSHLGSTLDAGLVDCPLIRGYRCLLTIQSRSGETEWLLRGSIKRTSTSVAVVFDRTGGMRIRVRNPVHCGPGAHERTITCSREEAEQFIRGFVDKSHSRGRAVEVRGPTALGPRPLILDVTFDAVTVKRALLKIAFLAVCGFLGDEWLQDPLLPDWHEVLFAEDPNQLEALRLRAQAFGEKAEAVEALEMLFPKLSMGEHGVAVVHIPGVGIIAAVILFGDPLFSVVATVSETHDYGVRELTGISAICNARSRNTQVGFWVCAC